MIYKWPSPFLDESEETTIDADLNDHQNVPIGDIDWKKSSCKVIKWRRFNKSSSILIRPDVQPSDIIQGLLGNCWLLSALAIVVQHDHLLSNILPTSSIQFQQVRKATVRLFNNGKWNSIVVDDWLPCDQRGKLIFSEAKRNQLFVPLVEKAMAKLYGGYHRLIGGHTSKALTAFTGYPCELISLPTSSSLMLEFWLKIISYNSAKFLMTVSCGRHNNSLYTPEHYEKLGLLPDHAYSVLDVQAIGSIRLVKLRNPWGSQVWKGDWSEQSSLWSNKLKRQLGQSKHLSRQGIFWISFTDLCSYFDDLVVCKIRKDWFEYRFEGSSFPISFKNLSKNKIDATTVLEMSIKPEDMEQQYKPMVVGYTQLMTTLYQTNDLFSHPQLRGCAIMMLIYELCASQTNHVLSKFIGSSYCHCQSSTTLEVELKQGRRYLLVAFAFQHGEDNQDDKEHCLLEQPQQQSNYVLRIHSTRPLKLKWFESNPALLGELIIYYVRNCGKSFTKGANIITHHLNRNWPGLITVVENPHSHQWLQVSMKSTFKFESIEKTPGDFIQENLVKKDNCPKYRCPQSSIQNDNDHCSYTDQTVTVEEKHHCLFISRGSMNTVDLIGPGQCQLINMIINRHRQPNSSISITMNFKFISMESFFNHLDPADDNKFKKKVQIMCHHPDIISNYGLHSVRPIV